MINRACRPARRGFALAVVVLVSLAVSPILAGCGGGGDKGSPSLLSQRTFALGSLEKKPVTINGATFQTWIMDTEAKRAEGFMFVGDSEVKSDEGMLFVFQDARGRGFYEKNTSLALDIAFIGADRRIISIKQLKPFDETIVGSDGDAQYALEVKQGTLAARGIAVGQAVILPEGVTAHD